MSLSETKPQRWRALALYNDGQEALLRLGSNIAQVTESYEYPFFELLDDEEREKVKEIHLQKWNGTADKGCWESQKQLPVPSDDLDMKIGAKKELV